MNNIIKGISCPITMIIFNRYDKAKKVFEQVKLVKPPKLLIVADGPRESRPNEKELCEKTRSIISEIDWDCEVLTNFSEKNMGCKNRIASGLDWVFSQVEESIILEDDCIPSLSFFYFCELFPKTSAKYFPVYDFSHSATCSGVPDATTHPPPLPPSGPISII